METYRYVLVALDLCDENDSVCMRAAELAKKYSAQLSLLHVVEHVPVDLGSEMIIPAPLEIEEQLVARAEAKLAALAEELGSEKVDTHVKIGATKSEIIHFAEDNDVDLIVIGRHSRHGIAKLLGSTANAVLHNTPCDVLAINITEK